VLRAQEVERATRTGTNVAKYLGWAATGVFVGSYLCARAAALKRVQMLGALMWVVYGVLIDATPVVAANLLVFGATAVALTREKRRAPLRRFQLLSTCLQLLPHATVGAAHASPVFRT
jgi:hypothetical protein